LVCPASAAELARVVLALNTVGAAAAPFITPPYTRLPATVVDAVALCAALAD